MEEFSVRNSLSERPSGPCSDNNLLAVELEPLDPIPLRPDELELVLGLDLDLDSRPRPGRIVLPHEPQLDFQFFPREQWLGDFVSRAEGDLTASGGQSHAKSSSSPKREDGSLPLTPPNFLLGGRDCYFDVIVDSASDEAVKPLGKKHLPLLSSNKDHAGGIGSPSWSPSRSGKSFRASSPKTRRRTPYSGSLFSRNIAQQLSRVRSPRSARQRKAENHRVATMRREREKGRFKKCVYTWIDVPRNGRWYEYKAKNSIV